MAVALLGAQASAAPRPTPPATIPNPDQDAPPPPVVPRGENFSAKPAPQLFASDCTGAGCHRGPQGLAKGQNPSSLASFLRQHYTNSSQSAAALAAYLASVPGAPADARRQKIDRPPHEPTASTKQDPRNKKNATAKQPRGKQATVEPAHVPSPAPGAEPPAAATPTEPTPTTAAPAPAAPASPPPAPASPKTFDIFD